MLADKLILALYPVKFITMEDIVADHHYPFNEKEFRELMRLKHRNGLDKLCKMVGNKLYFDKEKFNAWMVEYKKNPLLRVHQLKGKMNPTEEKRVGVRK